MEAIWGNSYFGKPVSSFYFLKGKFPVILEQKKFFPQK